MNWNLTADYDGIIMVHNSHKEDQSFWIGLLCGNGYLEDGFERVAFPQKSESVCSTTATHLMYTSTCHNMVEKVRIS